MTTAIEVFWQPGCTSCLRTKEFLAKNGVAFLSRNVLTDATALSALQRFGVRQVPVVVRGDAYVDGQVLADVARLCGIAYGAKNILPAEELLRRLDLILEGTGRFLLQIPGPELATLLPNRPRSHADLVFHIFNIADAFLEHDAGIPLVFDAYNRVPPRGWEHRHIAAYGADVRRRTTAWGQRGGHDWSAAADVYYGRQTLHEFLERTTWHAGQHTRQLMWTLSERLGIPPERPLANETWTDLPMPDSVWDPA